MQILQQIEQKLWRPIHILLVQNQVVIKKVFLITYILCTLAVLLGFYLFSAFPEIYLFFYKFSGKIGGVSLYLFLLALLPGIFQRFKVLPLWSASIVLFRRQIGILMFFFAIIHSMYIFTIPAIMFGVTGLEQLSLNAITGIATIVILFPVWITSNDISQKKMGKLWKTVQRLTYFAMIAIFFHVALIETFTAFLTGTVFILELASWLKIWFFKPATVTSV